MIVLLKAIVLGIVEGVTEFLPVSSTGHLIVAAEMLDFHEMPPATFEIFIQLGAILAVVWDFRAPLARTVRNAVTSDGADRALLAKVLLAFIPAAALGLLAGDTIEAFLFNPTTVGIALIVGGVIILVIERWHWPFTAERIEAVTWRQALWVGLAQVTALIPGVSRAGATIIGGVLAGMDRPTATQFSFYLAIPTLVAASLYSLLKSLSLLSPADALPLAVGFVTAFFSAMIVVRAFLGYVRGHDFRVFGYYRILAGLVILALLR
jgi:undecaprenyl-diphosphatase